MASKQKTGGASGSASAGSAAATAAPPAKLFALDTTQVEKRVWLVKVPDVVADLVAASAGVDDTIGSFQVTSVPDREASGGAGAGAGAAGTGAGAGAGRKRQRTQMTVELSKTRILQTAGSEGAEYTPVRYTLTLEEPVGARVMTHSTGATAFTMLGVASHSGTMVPDPADPAYGKYVAQRSKAKKPAPGQARGTSLADGDVVASIMAARREAPPLAALAAADAAAEAAAARAPATSTVPRATSVLELFEKGALWTLKNMMEATGKKDAEVRADAQKYCDYIRSGDYARYYILKKHLRNQRTPLPDPEVEKHVATEATSSTGASSMVATRL